MKCRYNPKITTEQSNTLSISTINGYPLENKKQKSTHSMYTHNFTSVKADSSTDVYAKRISSDSPLSTHANCQKMVISFLFFYFLMDILCSLEQQVHLWKKHSEVSSVKTETGPEGNDHPIHPLNNAL